MEKRDNDPHQNGQRPKAEAQLNQQVLTEQEQQEQTRTECNAAKGPQWAVLNMEQWASVSQ